MAQEEVAVELSPSQVVSRELHEILQHLQAGLAGTLGSVLVDDQGFPLAWDLKGGADVSLIATASAAVARVCERGADALDFGQVRNAVIATDKGSVALFRVSAHTGLVVLLQPSTNNILVMVEVNKALDALRQVIASGF
ncbi:MAG TPA: roadblock/LC7 domain-containing protein [Candidatus Thermoplasmatota archaeon]|nr:roadblock/LC7 domain-containing protein [Candidatus Thermoplasmatota archaeon]